MFTNNMTQDKKTYTLKWTWFVLSQVSILLFGTFVGCWVTVLSRQPELNDGDTQIILIRNLGIAFTVLFFVFLALTGVFYYMYKKSKSTYRPKANPNVGPSLNKNPTPTKQAPTIILNKTTNMNIPSMPASKLVAPSRTVASSKPISPALAKPLAKPATTIPAKTVTPSSSKTTTASPLNKPNVAKTTTSKPTTVAGKPIGASVKPAAKPAAKTTAKTTPVMAAKPNIAGIRK